MSINVVGFKINQRSFTDMDDMLPDEVSKDEELK